MSSSQWTGIDRELADVEASFDFLSLVSPVEPDRARERFEQQDCTVAPDLELREPGFDPSPLLKRIEALDIDAVGDVEVQFLLASKRSELEWQLDMIAHRNTRCFLSRSMLHYGTVTRTLLAEACRLLDRVAADNGRNGKNADADAVRERAEEELGMYREQDPSLETEIEETDEQESLQAKQGNLVIPTSAELPPDRLEALTQHEIGVHVVTYHNGAQQPLQVLRNGLADYDELQEAVGVIAEYFADGLTGVRMRTLAARVIATDTVEGGADFVETYRTLREHDIPHVSAFDLTASVHACGGFTREQIYLRGLLWLLDYLAAGGALEPLYTGKIGHHHLPTIERMLRRQVLKPPALIPAFLQNGSSKRKLRKLRRGVRADELVK